MGLEPLKQEAGSEQSWSIMFLWVNCSWEEKKRTQGCSVGLRKGRVASDALYLCDVTGSRDIWVHHCEFHLWVSLEQQGSFRRGGERELPGVTGRGAMTSWLSYSPSFLGLPPLLLAQGAWTLQSSSHCDLVGVRVGFFPGTFLKWGGRFFPGTSLRWGWAYFLIVSNSACFISHASLTPKFV